jgi:galactonate dehydratase
VSVPGTDVVLRSIDLVHAQVTPKTLWSFLRIVSSDGLAGVGEASIPRGAAAVDAAVDTARAAAEGKTVADALAFVDNAPRETLADAAIASALEQAMWDIKGKAAGQPVWELVGGGGSRRIPLYANINRRTLDRTPAGFAASARDAVAAGFQALKIAPFDDLTPRIAEDADGGVFIAAGIARIAAVRDAIGPARELFVDCHWRFTPPAAKRTIDALAALRVVWFECPVTERSDTIDAIVALRAHANAHGMRLAGLEELTSAAAFRPWLAAGAYDVVMPDVKYCGGIAALIAIGEEAARHGIACAPHNPTGPVCHAASLAACAALPPPGLLELQWDETPAFYAMGRGLPRPEEGLSAVPNAPGLGVELDLTKMGA